MNRELVAALEFGKPLHKKIIETLQARLRMSERAMSARYAQMAQNEELFQSFIPERDVDAVRRQNRETGGQPEYRTIEVPHSYATLMTAHTYYCSVFLARTPILQLAGRHGEAEQKRLAIESLMGYQAQVGMMSLPWFIWMLDPGKYGYSVLGHHWDQEMIRVRQSVKEPTTFFGMPIPGTEKWVDKVEDVVGYEGNRAYNVRPQDFFPDPRVPLVHFQRGEFCSRYVETPWSEIYAGRNSRYFNYEKLLQMRRNRDQQEGGVATRDQGSDRVTTLPGTVAEDEAGYDVPVGFVKGHEMYIKLVPDQWRIGKGDREEIWVFNFTTNGVIFGATPLGELHGKFPFDVLLDEVDGYTCFPKSSLERLKPLNDVMTWLINTHFYNVRQTINNQFLVDPSMVVMKDVMNPAPGKYIRLKPEAYGKDVRTALHQLQTFDVTKNHIGQDLNVIVEMVQRLFGTSDQIMGMVNAGGRKTATEIRTSSTFGINRLKTQCEWFSTVGWSPMTQKMVQRTQQHYTAEKKFRLVGDVGAFAPQFIDVNPMAIAGFWDFEAVDGTLPVDRFAQANLWQMIMGQMKEYPQIMMQYDIAKIFGWVAHLAGIKNIAQFKVVPDATAMANMQAGNVVPLKTAMGERNMQEPRQIPGAGPTG